MITVIKLPPEPAPRLLTANAQIQSLRDHFLVFLANNNQNGFNDEIVTHISANSIGELMLLAALNDSMKIEKFKREAKKLKKMSDGAISHSQGLELMSRLFGYSNWNEANQCFTGDSLDNRRTDRAQINMKVFSINGGNAGA